MNPARKEMMRPPHTRPQESRRQGRFRCEMLHSTLGSVSDLSPMGMQVLRKGLIRPRCDGRSISVKLRCALGALHIKARVVWVEKQSLRRHRVGLEFVGLDEQTRTHLTEVARFSGCPRFV